MKRESRVPVIPLPWMMAFALAGIGINLLLLLRHLAGGGLAGCGGGSSCEQLLHSRWGQVLGIPVSGFGLLVYLGLMLAILAQAWRWVGGALGMLVGAAAWFVIVQAMVIGRFCPWCMAAHAIGFTVAMLGGCRLASSGGTKPALFSIGGTAAATAAGIALLQVAGPQPVTHRIDHAAAATVTPNSESVHARGSGRKASFADGRKIYDVAALPHLGPVDARFVLVEYFDYSCAACRTMSGYLDALLAKHPRDLCVILLPVPMEHACNHALASSAAEHPGSCHLARLALAIWRAHPEAFAAFHHWLLDAPEPSAAHAKALTLVPATKLEPVLNDPWLNELIEADVRDWVTFSNSTRTLPKLLVRDQRIVHGLPSGEADFIRVMERELGL